MIEAEDRTTLCLFNSQLIKPTASGSYSHIMLIDGNDERGIDVGLLTRGAYPIMSVRSHVHDEDAEGVIFSRDCAEFDIGLPSGKRMWVMVNHLKSKGYGSQARNDAKRKRQAARIRAIYDAHMAAGDDLVAIVGDLNETPDKDPLTPLFNNGSSIKDVVGHSEYNDGGFPGTHGNCGPSAKLDYILLSPKLYARVKAAGIERKGMWGGVNGDRWERFPEVTVAEEAASDHAAVWVDLDI